MVGKSCVITGGAGGIGKATAIGLARLGAKVVISGRDPGRGEAAVAEIRAASPGTDVLALTADLSSQQEVRGLAAEILSIYLASLPAVAAITGRYFASSMETAVSALAQAPVVQQRLHRVTASRLARSVPSASA